ncbi:MAG: hypothetical protein M3N29_04115 [Chloroflexota bacterium]|nr:hypothetical protein [Chloroflexota bacterium]
MVAGVVERPGDREQRTPRPVRHEGSCGERYRCWRRSCREHWPRALTVEVLRNRTIVAHCHGAGYTSTTGFDFQVDDWRHGDESETWP